MTIPKSTLPEPPSGHFWRVREGNANHYFKPEHQALAVELRRKSWIGSEVIEKQVCDFNGESVREAALQILDATRHERNNRRIAERLSGDFYPEEIDHA